MDLICNYKEKCQKLKKIQIINLFYGLIIGLEVFFIVSFVVLVGFQSFQSYFSWFSLLFLSNISFIYVYVVILVTSAETSSLPWFILLEIIRNDFLNLKRIICLLQPKNWVQHRLFDLRQSSLKDVKHPHTPMSACHF